MPEQKKYEVDVSVTAAESRESGSPASESAMLTYQVEAESSEAAISEALSRANCQLAKPLVEKYVAGHIDGIDNPQAEMAAALHDLAAELKRQNDLAERACRAPVEALVSFLSGTCCRTHEGTD